MGGFLAQFGFPAPSFNFNNGGGPPITDQQKSDYQNGIGRWNVYESVSDSLDPATVRTSATNYKLYWYTRQGTQWIYKETGTNKYVTLTPQDGGILWVVVVIPSGQAYYVDYQKIKSNNGGYVTDYQYTDVDGDGVKEFAFAYNMKGQPIPNSGYPSVTFLGFLLTYDASFTGLNNLANATGIGSTTTTKFYDYYLAFSAAKKGVGIYKVEVKVTSTDETKVRLKKLNVPGLGYLDGSVFTKTVTATDYRYDYQIATNFDGALYLSYATNTNNRYDSTLSLEYTLTHPDDILITLTYYYFVAQTEAGASVTDTFYAQE
jgi:hypothetical protein